MSQTFEKEIITSFFLQQVLEDCQFEEDEQKGVETGSMNPYNLLGCQQGESACCVSCYSPFTFCNIANFLVVICIIIIACLLYIYIQDRWLKHEGS